MDLTNLTKKEKHCKQFPKREKWSKNIKTKKLKPLSLFISILLMLKKALDNVKIEK